MINYVFSHNLPGKAVHNDKEVGCPVLTLKVDVLYVHVPYCIGRIHADNGFHNPHCRTAVIVSMVEEAVLLQDAEDLFPVDPVTGALQVLCDLLVAITDEFRAQQIRNISQELVLQERITLAVGKGKEDLKDH